MSDESLDVKESNWSIITKFLPSGEKRTIVNNSYPDAPIQYNYKLHTPIVLAPISRHTTFIVSAYYEDHKLKMCLHDLRYINGEIVNGFTIQLRGNKFQLSELKNILNRFCDQHRCVAVNFLFRKMFNCGFSCMYAEKILKPKTNSSLRAAVTIVQSVTDKPEEYNEIIKTIGEDNE